MNSEIVTRTPARDVESRPTPLQNALDLTSQIHAQLNSFLGIRKGGRSSDKLSELAYRNVALATAEKRVDELKTIVAQCSEPIRSVGETFVDRFTERLSFVHPDSKTGRDQIRGLQLELSNWQKTLIAFSPKSEQQFLAQGERKRSKFDKLLSFGRSGEPRTDTSVRPDELHAARTAAQIIAAERKAAKEAVQAIRIRVKNASGHSELDAIQKEITPALLTEYRNQMRTDLEGLSVTAANLRNRIETVRTLNSQLQETREKYLSMTQAGDEQLELVARISRISAMKPRANFNLRAVEVLDEVSRDLMEAIPRDQAEFVRSLSPSRISWAKELVGLDRKLFSFDATFQRVSPKVELVQNGITEVTEQLKEYARHREEYYRLETSRIQFAGLSQPKPEIVTVADSLEPSGIKEIPAVLPKAESALSQSEVRVEKSLLLRSDAGGKEVRVEPQDIHYRALREALSRGYRVAPGTSRESEPVFIFTSLASNETVVIRGVLCGEDPKERRNAAESFERLVAFNLFRKGEKKQLALNFPRH